MSKKNLSEELKQQIVNEWTNGKKTIAQLAKEHGCSEQSIRNWAKKNITDTSVCDNTSGPLGVDIPANRVPALALYSLEEASRLAKITVEQLLYYAIRGDIKAYIINTKNYCFIDQVGLDVHDSRYLFRALVNSCNLPTKQLYKPYLLSLSKDDCKKLATQEAIHVQKFPSIVVKADNDELSIKLPRKADDLGAVDPLKIISGDYQFFYPVDNQNMDASSIESLELIFTNIRFIAKELSEFIEQERSVIPKRNSIIELFATHTNKSSLLVDLDAAAFEMYGTYNPIKAAHYDTTEKISTYLMERFGFFKIHADVAAEVILPSSNNPIKDDNQSEYRPRLLQLLIQAWNELCINKEFKKDDEIKYDCDADDWFNDNFKH
ncbi:MAG TPA: transposase, partial [Agitococcus sp.]|nr:transposase [Agitococcus sp.]